jgi:hypothetical protein
MPTNHGVHEGEWQTVGSKNSENEWGVHAGTITGENGGSPTQVAVPTQENGNNRGRSNSTGIDNTSKDDGMQSYHAKTDYIEVRFMTGNIKGFKVTRALCIGADVPNSKTGIEQYFRHDVKFNNINGKLRIRTLQGLGQLKSGRSKFRVYLEHQGVYINKAQLGEEDGITLGWTLKAHPAFCYRDNTKETLYKMGDEFKGVQYAFLPKTIKYKRSKDGAKITTNLIKPQVTKTSGITVADFRADMEEKWQKMTAKTGGTLFGKTFIPFGKEGDIRDDAMTNIIQQHTTSCVQPSNAL